MKKLMVIGTVGFCSLLIGITVIAKEQTMDKNEVTVREGVSPDDDTQNAEVKDSTVIAQEKGSYNNNMSGKDAVVSPAAPQEEAPVMQQQETAIGNMADAEFCVQQAPCNTEGCTFIDENHDGLCDYGDVHHHNGAHMDANHDGYCDYGDHYCMNDSDGDGVCDNYQTTNNNQHHNNEYCAGNASGSQSSGSHHSNGHHGGRHH